MSQHFKVVNHEKYQHYKDRCPPWVKLHASVLEDYDFGCLPDASKAHAMLIWVLASRHNNRLPFDPRWVAQQIQATEPVDLDALVSAGFIEMYQDASAALAPLVQRTEDRGQKQPSDTSYPAAAEIERFWKQVQKSEDGCWLWTGSKRPDGYGVIRISGKLEAAHRVSLWISVLGRRPVMDVLHSCDVRACVNPAHLREGTESENALEAFQRHPHPGLKLSHDQVADIRAKHDAGATIRHLAGEYSVAISTISNIVNGLTRPAKASGEADRKSDLGTLMGAIRKVGYRKATTRRDEMRDYSVAKAMLASHPVETCLDAIEGTRRLVGESEHFTLRLVWAEGKDGGPPMFTRALDAVAKPAGRGTRERTGPSDVGSILKTMGAA